MAVHWGGRGPGHLSRYTAAGEIYNFIIDAANGDDSNDGSISSPWKSLSKISSIPLAAGTVKRVLIKTGTYSTSSDYVLRSDSSSGGTIGSGATLEIVFETGTVMDGTLANASAAQNGFEFDGANIWTATIIGNGLTVQNYDWASGDSPNGFGNRGYNILKVYNAHVANCVDGFSSHGNAQMYLYDCSAADCRKSAYAHVENAQVWNYRCTFTGRASASLGIGSIVSATASVYFERCAFIPISSGQAIGIDCCTFSRCQIGTLTASVVMLSGQNVGGTISDSFLNAFADGNMEVTVERGFGKFSTRVRNGGTVNVQHSVFSNPASGKTAIVFSDFNPGSASKLVFKNNIIETSTAAAFMSVDATNAGYLASAGSEFFNNCLSGSAAYDADYISADSGGTGRAGSITADALIGAANTLLMADYAYETGSPCIGAGTGGSDIGFGASQVVDTGAP